VRIISQKTIIDVIKQRYSVRAYQSVPLTDKDRNLVEECLVQKTTNPFDGELRFKLINILQTDSTKKIKLNTYGFIRGARHYIVAIAKPSENILKHTGYAMENVILDTTRLNLGTCWIAGTFNRKQVAKHVDLNQNSNEFIPAISPVGYITEKQNLRASTIRFLAKAKKRKKWEELFFIDDYHSPLSESMAENYQQPLQMLRLAPSASNKQPWRIITNDKLSAFHFFISTNIQKTPILNSLIPFRLEYLDIGIAVNHFDLTCKKLNLQGSWLEKTPSMSIHPNWEYVISWFENGK